MIRSKATRLILANVALLVASVSYAAAQDLPFGWQCTVPGEGYWLNGVVNALFDCPSVDEQAAPPDPTSDRSFLLRVMQCWNVGSLSSEALQTVVTISVQMSRDGRPETGSIRMIESRGGSDAAARQAYEAARRAVIRCGANGYDLPEESYDHWRELEITFNPEEMRLR